MYNSCGLGNRTGYGNANCGSLQAASTERLARELRKVSMVMFLTAIDGVDETENRTLRGFCNLKVRQPAFDGFCVSLDKAELAIRNDFVIRRTMFLLLIYCFGKDQEYQSVFRDTVNCHRNLFASVIRTIQFMSN